MDNCIHYALYKDPTWGHFRCIDCDLEIETEEN